MKCPGCGAEVTGKFCAMCGTKIPEQNYQANNAPQPATQNFNNNFQQNNAPMQNPYQVQSQSTVKKTSNKNALAIILISLILAVILAGHYAPNPAEMLGDEQFSTLLRMESQRYDYVFVDTPPLGQVIDAALVGQYCDGAVLVLESGAASRQAAQRVKDQIEKSGCRILGAVLNRVSREGEGYYGSKYGRYGKYGKYGTYGEYSKYGPESK